jgi:transposase InsO family protein
MLWPSLDRLLAVRTVFVSLILTARASLRSRAALQLEILALRHQLHVLERSRPRQLRLTRSDRLLWVWISRVGYAWRVAVIIVKPETVIAWHRRGFRLFWTWKSHRLGRPTVPSDIRTLIRTMSEANPLWGAPRIHGEMLKLGIDISQATVAKYLVRRRRPPSQTWRTFLRNHADQIVAADFFVVPTITYRLLFVLVVMAHHRRRIVHVAVTAHPTAAWTSQQLREAFPEDEAPRYLIHDRDDAFAGLEATASGMGINEVRTAPRSPWQNAYAERLIGSIRRECLDHVIVVSEPGLRRVLHRYVEYYERSRTHLALEKDTPLHRPIAPSARGSVVAIPQVGGLHHRYERRAA